MGKWTYFSGLGIAVPTVLWGRNSGLGQRIVTRVEIFAILVRNSQAYGCTYGIGGNSSHLLHLHKHALVRWKLAILSKKLLLLRVQLLQKEMRCYHDHR
jgi:hypothetical protein